MQATPVRPKFAKLSFYCFLLRCFACFAGHFSSLRLSGLCGGAKRGRFAIGILEDEDDDEHDDESSISEFRFKRRRSGWRNVA